MLANPGADEVRATIKVVTPTSVFAPSGVDPVRVAPDTTEAVSLDDVLAQAAKDGAIGRARRVERPGHRLAAAGGRRRPLPAHRRARVDAATAVVVPAGPKHLLLAGADAVGVRDRDVVLRAREAAGPAAGRARPRARARTSPSPTTQSW